MYSSHYLNGHLHNKLVNCTNKSCLNDLNLYDGHVVIDFYYIRK